MADAPNTYDAEPIPEAAREEIDRLLNSGDLFRYTAPENAPVSLLEAEFAEVMGTRFALAVSSCSAAIFLSLRALGLPEGAKVAIPAFTFAAVPSAIVHAGLTPVLSEVDDSLRLNIADFETKLDQGVSAVLISHMRGHTSDMDAIMRLAAARDLPVIEDAAHSLGTLWDGRTVGTIGSMGCFSFQSYKLVNAGEGGILITDDEDLIAKAVIMSGAYEHNWKKHATIARRCEHWQNRLPLYNMRMNNLSAAVIRPQLPFIEKRVSDGRRNHDYVAAALNASPWMHVPPPLEKELRAPDSIQFLLEGMTEDEIKSFALAAKKRGVSVQVFGMSQNNARAFWNWQFLGDVPELELTRNMLMRTCDVRLPARLTRSELDFVAAALCGAATDVKGPSQAVA